MSSAEDSDSYSSASEAFAYSAKIVPRRSTRLIKAYESKSKILRAHDQCNHTGKPWRKPPVKGPAPQPPPSVRQANRNASFVETFQEADARIDALRDETLPIPKSNTLPQGSVVKKRPTPLELRIIPEPVFAEGSSVERDQTKPIFLTGRDVAIADIPSANPPAMIDNRSPAKIPSTLQSFGSHASDHKSKSYIAVSLPDNSSESPPITELATDSNQRQDASIDDMERVVTKGRKRMRHSVSCPESSRRAQQLSSYAGQSESFTQQSTPSGHQTHLAKVEEEVHCDKSSWVVEKWRDDFDNSCGPVTRPRTDSVVSVAHICEDLLVSRRFRLKVTLTNFSLVVLAAAFIMPNFAAILFNLFRLVFGMLFPAYYSYKAVRTKDLKGYVTWMMYWIVFALFTCVETFTDIFLAFWFPFYYEIKIIIVLWLLSPATRGSSYLYRTFVHPWLITKEDEIDDCIEKAKQQGYSTVVGLGTKSVQYATNIIMQTALKGGGGLVTTLQRSYSTNDVGQEWPNQDVNRNVRELTANDCYEDAVDYQPRSRSDSDGGRLRANATSRSKRAIKTKSADISELLADISDGVPQRRSPRIQEATNSASGSSQPDTTTKKSRTDGGSYASLPRTSSRRAASRKKQN